MSGEIAAAVRANRPASCRSDFPAILKSNRAGINTAQKECTSGIGITDRNQTNKRQEESNSMLNKLNKRRGGFTLVEIMIVVAIIALLAAIAVPGFLRARKRSQASRIINDLRLIDSAVDQYAIENNKTSGSAVPVDAWKAYLKRGSALYNTGNDLFNNSYGGQTVDELPKVPSGTWNTLSDVAGTEFFSPYAKGS
jgi:prepilin-type N-terminal cleavage/methylation domain-containing protein